MTTPPDATSEEQLIARTRSGDMDAYDELYRRHVDDATKVARIVTNNSDEAQDIVAEAFTRVLGRLREGGGPDVELTPYLRTIVRRLAIDRHRHSQRDGSPADPTALEVLPRTDDPMARFTNRQLVRHAFETLPERWQQVLWHTEIEGRSAASLAPALGSSPNAVAALAYRAREGLRQAYLAVNLSAEVEPECRSYAPKVAPYVRGTLSAHDTREMGAHLAECGHCRERRDELLLLVSDMRGVLWPALLLPASAAAAAAAAGAAGAAGGGVLAFLSPSSWGPRAKQLAATSAGVAAAGIIAASAFLIVSGDDPDEPQAVPSATSEPDTSDEAPDNEPDNPPDDSEPDSPDDDAGQEDSADPEPESPDSPDGEPSDPPDSPSPSETPDESPSETPPEPTESPTEPTQSPTPSEPPDDEEPPVVDVQPPSNPEIVAGGDVTLSVEISGNPAPELQWQYADPPGSGDNGDSAAASFAGSSSSTPVWSPGSTLSATAPASLTYPPATDAADTPSPSPSASVTSSPSPSPTEPQEPTEDDWVDIDGATSPTLVIPAPDAELNGRSYRVLATNDLGTTATSPAVLSVQYAPEVSLHPEDVTTEDGGAANFDASASANPGPVDVTWQFRAPGGEWARAEYLERKNDGANSGMELTDVPAEYDGYSYRAVFTNDIGTTASEPASLSVNHAPSITEQPEDVDVHAGDDATFTATADAAPGADWQWETAATSDGPWTPIEGAAGGPDDEASLTVADVDDDDGAVYRVVYTNEVGSATSDPAELTVLPPTGTLEFDHSDGSTECVRADSTTWAGGDKTVATLGDCADATEWELPGDGTIRSAETGQCLDSFRFLIYATVHECDGSPSQDWEIDSTTSKPQQIGTGTRGFCLDARRVDQWDRGSLDTGQADVTPEDLDLRVGLWLLPCLNPSDDGSMTDVAGDSESDDTGINRFARFESQLFRFDRETTE